MAGERANHIVRSPRCVPSLRRALICTSKSAGGAAGGGAGQVTMRDENGAVSGDRAAAAGADRTNGHGEAPAHARKLDGYFRTREKLITRRAVLWLGQTCNIRCHFCY